MAHDEAGYVAPWANVSWQTPTTPRSREHDDIYWSVDSGPREKRHVFIGGNDLPKRWSGLQDQQFTLGEIGFGFGLNFFLTTNLWRRCKPRNAILNYVAFEKAPIAPKEIAHMFEALASQLDASDIDHSTLSRHMARLTACYPLPSFGQHLAWIDDDICLTLAVGDAHALMQGCSMHADAWYLDGFSPACNESAWQADLFEAMVARSRPGATVATYSVAGKVRHGLAAAGFDVARRPGFGTKAEMLAGRLPGHWRAAALPAGPVAVVGAGIAGLHCARALGRRGIETVVFEARDSILAGASCVPRFTVSPRLAARPDMGSLFSLSAFQYAMTQEGACASGCYRIATRDRDAQRHSRIAGWFPPTFCEHIESADAARRTGVDARHATLWLDTAGWCEPAKQFARLADTVTLNTGVSITGLERGDAGMRLHTSNGARHEFGAVIIASGDRPFPGLESLGLVPVRGQAITAVVAADVPEAVVAGPLSIVPLGRHEVLAGATFTLDDATDSVSEADSAQLAAQLERLFRCKVRVTGAYAGVRCTTRDRWPAAGTLGPRVYVCTGFGSHGATHAPLCAEHLVRRITGEPDGLGEGWSHLLDPARLMKK